MIAIAASLMLMLVSIPSLKYDSIDTPSILHFVYVGIGAFIFLVGVFSSG